MTNIDEKNSRPVDADGIGNIEETMPLDMAESRGDFDENQPGTQAVPQSLAAALQWAAAGFRVFPLTPDDKRPLPGSHGFKEASSDPAVVSNMRWQVEGNDCNVGVATGDGLVVLDVDQKGGKNGWESLATVGITPESLASLGTYTVATPTDGRHFWLYSAQAVSTGTDVLGPGSGVDVRGEGGYIVVPPSRRPEGAYVVSSCGNACDAGDNLPRLTKLANWSALGGKIQRPVPPPPPPRPSIPISDAEMQRMADRARAYLAKCAPAISGQGGHNQTFSIASTLVNGFLLPPDIALDLLLTDFNPRCRPPWSEKDLRHKVESALGKGPPEGKSYGWQLGADATSVCSEDGDIPVVELPELDDEEKEAGGGKEEAVEDVPLPPGPVGDFAELIMSMSRFPYQPFAILAALVGFATVASRKFRYENLYPSLYGAMLAIRSNGKEDVQWPVEEALSRAGLDKNHIMSRVTSYNAAIEQLMGVWYHPVLFAGVDEGGGFMDAARKGEFGLKDFLKEVWSKCGRWQHPWRRKKNRGNVNLQSIYHPALNILLAAQPAAMGAASSFAEIEDGLLPRCIWVARTNWGTVPNKDAPKHSQDLSKTNEGQKIVARMKNIWDWTTPKKFSFGSDKHFRDMAEATKYFQEELDGKVGDGEKEGLWPSPVQVGVSSGEVETLFDSFELDCRQKAAPGRGKQAMLAGLWSKGTENAKRVALTLAVARFGRQGPFQINAEEASWAIRFICAAIRSGIQWGTDHLFQNSFQAQCETVYAVIRDGQAVTRSELTRRLQHQYRARDIQESIETLEAEGKIEPVHISTKGRKALGWRATGKRR